MNRNLLTAINVIDVSNHNGDIDFKKVKAAGAAGVILRIGLTGYGVSKTKRADKLFEVNYKNATEAGLAVGGYWYSCAYDEAEAQEEAAKTLELLQGKRFDLPVYIDIEDEHNTKEAGVATINQKLLGRAYLTKVAVAFCEAIKAGGWLSGIYANKNWFDNYIDRTKITDYEKWIAHWNTKEKQFNLFKVLSDCSDQSGLDLYYDSDFGIWQYTACGRVDGISSDVDLDVCYRDYPTIIREAGLNGYEQAQKAAEDNGRYIELLEQYNELLAKYSALESSLSLLKNSITNAFNSFERSSFGEK